MNSALNSSSLSAAVINSLFLNTSTVVYERHTFKSYNCDAIPGTDGMDSYFTGTIIDITERRADDQRKNDFIGMVSHELKTPLTSLAAIVQVANAKLRRSDDIFLAGAMDKANIQVKKMGAMIYGF